MTSVSPTALGRVLVVDDEIQLMNALVEALTAEGYAVTGFLTGEDALEALQTQEFDLMLTDLMMPGMDGIALLKAGLAIDQNLACILMTGQGTVPTAVEAMKTGAFDYVLKPFRLQAILAVLVRAREVQRLRLENIQLRETVAIYNLSQTIAFSLDSKLVLESTADAALQQTDADEVSIMLLTPRNQELYIAAVRGKGREHLLGQHILLQEGIAGWVARQSEPLILNGEVSDPRFAPIRPRAEIRSAISMPMLAAGKLVGVLNVNRLKAHRPFTPGQIKALSILTSTAAAALENEALYSILQAREERFRALIENSSDAVTLLNPEGRFIYTSASVQRVLGYAPGELAGQNAFDLIHPDDRETMLAGFMEAVQKPREVATTQLRVRHKDGSWRWIEGTAQNLLNEPSVEAIVVNYRDISERKQTETAVLESERQMRALVTSLDDVVFEFDEQGTYLNVWAANESLLAQPKVQLLGTRIIEVLGEQNGRPFAEAVKRVITSGQPESIEYPLEVTGGQRWFVARVSPILDSDSAYRTASMLISDITARKQAEQAYAASQRRFQALIQHAPDGIALLGINGKLEQVTPSTQEILGYALEEAVEQDPALLTHPEDLPNLMVLLNDLIQNPDRVVITQYRFKHKDGSWRWLESTISNLFAEPSVQAIVFNYRDITERKQAEEALAASESRYRMLFESNPHPMWVYDLETLRFLAINDAAEYHYGYSQDEFLLMTIKDLRQAEDVSALMTNLLESNQELQASGTWRHSKKDGTLIDVEITSHFVRWEGRPARLVLANDVTERKQAEETFREKERLLSEAQRIGHIGSWNYDIVADTLIYSDEMYRLFDVTPEEFQHNIEGFLSVIYSSDRPMVAKWLEDIRAGRQAGELEFLIFHKNSELRYIRCRGAVKFDNTGKPGHYIGTAQDVTERKLAEIQIHQQIERLNALRKIDRAISSSFDLNVTLDILLSQVISQLQVDAADILLLNSDGETLAYAAGEGFQTNAIESARLRIDDSQVARERRSIHVENLANKPDERLLTTLGASEDFVCYFGIPLMVKGKVKGVLEIFHRTPLQPYPEWLDFLNTLAGQAAIAIENTTLFENLQRSNQELSQGYDATIVGWSRALDLRDKETEGHTLRVTEMTIKLARAFGLPEEQLLDIRRGALLHDIGKMGVPDNILLKPGVLTEKEWLLMRSHPLYAYDLLKPIAFLAPALDIPYCHHEKWDGTGYPRGLKGEEIPLVARLFAVVDVWDSLLSDRPYRPAWTREKAREYIRTQAGSHFEPRVAEFFLEMIKGR